MQKGFNYQKATRVNYIKGTRLGGQRARQVYIGMVIDNTYRVNIVLVRLSAYTLHVEIPKSLMGSIL